MGQQHDFYLVQTGNLVPRSASWRGFLACFQQPNPLRSANLDSSAQQWAVGTPAVLRFACTAPATMPGSGQYRDLLDPLFGNIGEKLIDDFSLLLVAQ